MPSIRTQIVSAVLFGVLLAAPFLLPVVGGEYLTTLLLKAMLLAIAAISLDLLVGQGGMVSLGHAAFVALGAYAAAIGLESGIEDILLLLAVALTVSGLFALVTGALALRTSGVYFLMITLAFGQMTYFTLTSLAPMAVMTGSRCGRSARFSAATWSRTAGSSTSWFSARCSWCGGA